MPAQIIKLEELVPGLAGTTFTLELPGGGEKSYHVPGDLDTQHVTGCLKLFEDMLAFQVQATELATKGDKQALSKTADALGELTEKIQAQLLSIFQITEPELKEFPFGQKTAFSILAKVLEMMGLAEPVGEGGANPPNRATRRAAGRGSATRTSTQKAGATRQRKAT